MYGGNGAIACLGEHVGRARGAQIARALLETIPIASG